jgi:hypothetical protein
VSDSPQELDKFVSKSTEGIDGKRDENTVFFRGQEFVLLEFGFLTVLQKVEAGGEAFLQLGGDRAVAHGSVRESGHVGEVLEAIRAKALFASLVRRLDLVARGDSCFN